MKAFSNYAEVQVNTGSVEKLPVGGYVITIKSVKYEDNSAKGKADNIIFAFDIAEGEYKGYYAKRFENDTNEDKKWKGTYRLSVPTDDGSQNDGYAKSRFKGFMTSVEESNPGYKWNWDEQTLKGKLVGAAVGEINTEIDGKAITYTAMRYAVSVDSVRKGITPPKPYTKAGSTTTTTSTTNPYNVTEDADIPF